jgi:hypothetical protein
VEGLYIIFRLPGATLISPTAIVFKYVFAEFLVREIGTVSLYSVFMRILAYINNCLFVDSHPSMD